MEACGRPASLSAFGPAPPCRESIYRPAVAIPRSTAVPYVCLTAPYSRVTRAYVSFTFRGLANVAAGCCAYTRRSFAARGRSRQGQGLTQIGLLLQSTVLGGAKPCRNRSFAAIRRSRQLCGLHKTGVCCNPPLSAAPRLTQTGRLQHSALLGSATPCRNWSFAAIRRSRQRHVLQELAVCCIRPFSATPRLTQIGHLKQTVTASPGSRQSPLPITIS